jgi:hypothetical protein
LSERLRVFLEFFSFDPFLWLQKLWGSICQHLGGNCISC